MGAALCLISAITFDPADALATAVKKETAVIATDKQLMKYDVFAGGFHVVSADLLVDLTKKTNYNLRLGAYTHGMLAKLAPWNGVFDTKGWYDTRTSLPRPQIHSSNTTFRDEKEIIEFLYNRDGSFHEFRMFNEDKNGKQPPQPKLSDNTTDVLSSTLAVMNGMAKTGKCEGKDRIFDGSRSYDLIFRHQQDVVLKATKLNVYAGPAIECTVEVKPIAGRWHEKPRGWMSIQEQGREKGTMPTIWFARMATGETYVPVKIRVKTDYGTLFMHMTAYTGPQKTIQIKK